MKSTRPQNPDQHLLFMWRDALRCDPRVSAEEYTIFREYADYADSWDGRNVKPGRERVASGARRNPRTVSRHMARGVRLGWFEEVQKGSGGRDGGHGHPAVYRLTIPQLPACHHCPTEKGHWCANQGIWVSLGLEKQGTRTSHVSAEGKKQGTPANKHVSFDDRNMGHACPPTSQDLSKDFSSENENRNQSERDASEDTFTLEPGQRFALKEEPEDDPSLDALKRRVVDHFAAKGVSRDDCVRCVDQLRLENIGDELIDAAVGQAVNADARSLNYLSKVAADFFRQRVPAVDSTVGRPLSHSEQARPARTGREVPSGEAEAERARFREAMRGER